MTGPTDPTVDPPPTSITRSGKESWHLYYIIVILIVFLTATGVLAEKEIQDNHHAIRRIDAQAARQDTELQCVKNWADATTARSESLSQLTVTRDDALDALIRAVPGATRTTFQVALARYLAASDLYKHTLIIRPPPPSPKFACGGVTSP